MDEEIEFSIILPTFNRKHCLPIAIQSVLNQSYTKFELIIIDDNSDDGTSNMIEKNYHNELGNKVKYVKLREKKGVSFCRNMGLKHASGNWIGYIDSDNAMSSLFFETMSNTIKENSNYKLFYCRYKTSKGEIKSHAYSREQLMIKNYIDLGTVVHKKELINEIGEFDESLCRLVDWDFLIRCSNVTPFYYVNKVLSYYNDDPDPSRITISEQYLYSYVYITRKYSINRPFVSVIVLSYNQEKYISKAIDSVLNQIGTFDCEIIISDDCSTDNTSAIIQKYTEKYPVLIRNVSSNTNKGIVSNYLHAINEAQGQYIAILEGDDYWCSNSKLQIQLKQIIARKSSMIFSKSIVYNEEKDETDILMAQKNLKRGRVSCYRFVSTNNMNPIITLSSCMFESSFIKKIANNYDYPFFSEIIVAFLAMVHEGILYDNEARIVYRVHKNGNWSGLTDEQKIIRSYKIRLIVKPYVPFCLRPLYDFNIYC